MTAGTAFDKTRRLRDWLLAGWLLVSQVECRSEGWLVGAFRGKIGGKTANRMLQLYRTAMARLAPAELMAMVDRTEPCGGVLWRPYVAGTARCRKEDLAAWLSAGWPRGVPHRPAGYYWFDKDWPMRILPYIGELVYKYEFRGRPIEHKFLAVLAETLRSPDAV